MFVTHDQGEALSMGDRVSVMRAGRLEGLATPADLYQRPPSPFIAEFIGAMNRVPGHVVGDRFDLYGTMLHIDGEKAVAHVRGRSFCGAITRMRVVLDEGTELLSDVPSSTAIDLVDCEPCHVSFLELPVLVREVSSA